MVFLGFIFISSIFFVFAAVSGNVFNFVNADSFIILLLTSVLFSIFTFKWKEFIAGIRSMFALKRERINKDYQVAAHYKSLMVVTVVVGIVSSCQGFISYALAIRDAVDAAIHLPLMEALCYAGFTVVYSLMISFLLYFPICILHGENDK